MGGVAGRGKLKGWTGVPGLRRVGSPVSWRWQSLRIGVAVLLGLGCGAGGGPPLSGQVIMNTERVQGLASPGLHGSLSLAYQGSRGNLIQDEFTGGGVVGVAGGAHWLRLIPDARVLNQGGNSLVDRRAVQLRYSYQPGEHLRSFHFVQLQRNRTLLLRERTLVGSGVQGRLLGGDRVSLEAGTGLMMEWELREADRLRPDEDPATRTLRMANLAVLRAGGGGPVLLSVLYAQPSVRSVGDLRLLSDTSVELPVTTWLRAVLALEWRHDRQPPADLRAHDVSFRSGFNLNLRGLSGS